MTARGVLLVALGGACGAVVRYAVNFWCLHALGPKFPWGTLVVNVAGCFLLGWLVQVANSWPAVSQSVQLGLATGFLGALTTFSTFGVQTLQLWQRSAFLGLLNVAGNGALGIAAAALGILVATWMTTPTS